MEMVKKVTVSLLDDLDGKAADETVQFALDGVSFEIDLSEKNAKKLRSALQPWVTAGRRTGGSRPTPPGSGRPARRSVAPTAPPTANGHARAAMRSPSAGGSPPRQAMDAYRAAH